MIDSPRAGGPLLLPPIARRRTRCRRPADGFFPPRHAVVAMLLLAALSLAGGCGRLVHGTGPSAGEIPVVAWESPGFGRGSAVVLGPDLLLTADHCLDQTRAGGAVAGGQRVRYQWIGGGRPPGAPSPEDRTVDMDDEASLRADWAVVLLTRPQIARPGRLTAAGDEPAWPTAAVLDAAPLRAGDRVWIAGYRARRLDIIPATVIEARSPRTGRGMPPGTAALQLHENVDLAGASGGALLRRAGPNGFAVVGILTTQTGGTERGFLVDREFQIAVARTLDRAVLDVIDASGG
ncbi:MAG: trypsin-like peptidase domain-containing protein [Phycisphaerales bacterium]